MQDTQANPYLEQEVRSSSPARLRWLLLQKAVGLCKVVEQQWEQGQNDVAAQWTLRLREILGELLAGIRSADPLARQVADIYIFSLQLLTAAEAERSVQKLKKLRELLDVELETWKLVVQQTSVTFNSSPTFQPKPVQSSALNVTELAQVPYQSISFEA